MGLRFVDIDKNTLNFDIEDLKQKVSDRTKAIMFQYTFGNSTGLDEVRKICDERNILLIDDVITTGSTIEVCVNILKKAGANKVGVFVVAHPLENHE